MDNFLTGKIILINKAIYTVRLDNNTIVNCCIRGKIRRGVDPVVGDNVEVDKNFLTIERVLPRINALRRPEIANIDKLFIIMSTKLPKFSSYLIDKFLVIAHANKIEPIIVITKMDTLSFFERLNIKKYIRKYKSLGYKVYINNQLYKIKKEFKSSVVALTGQTGSGKSTLLNKVDATLLLRTGEVSTALGRGKHTTRLVELIEIGDGLIADTPGFSSLELDIKKEEIKKYYKEFDIKCKYKTCLHNREDKCKVKERVLSRRIAKFRYDNYIKLLSEGK